MLFSMDCSTFYNQVLDLQISLVCVLSVEQAFFVKANTCILDTKLERRFREKRLFDFGLPSNQSFNAHARPQSETTCLVI